MILFLDTVSPLPEFSVIKENNIIMSIQILNENCKKISDRIIPVYLELQKKLQINDKIEKLIVCTGPGSFTALRVGIAFMYGLSISKKIPLLGIASFDLLRFVIPKSIKKKTLMIICSSNDQNFICMSSNQKDKYLIKKLGTKFESIDIDYNQYAYCISNCELPSNFIKMLNLNTYQEINFTEIVKLNLKEILSLPSNNIVQPIYISDNKILD